MKHSAIIPFILALSLGWGAMSRAQTPVSINGHLKVIGTKLCNKYGNPIQLRGMSTHGIQWFAGCLTNASLDTLAYGWGADILRITMYVQEGGYETDPAGYTSLVKQYVAMATARGMYALIDFHILRPGDPNYNLSNAITFFTDIANTYKNSNNVLYEICNEPNGVTWSTIKTYADQVIPVIKAIDTGAVICVGTRGWSSLGYSEGRTAQDIVSNPLNYSNILYSFHFYAASHQDAYLSQLDWASDRLPIFVTEFGTQASSGDGPNDFTMSQKYIDLMQAKKISWTNWNYADASASGGVWVTGTCGNGPWTVSQLKEAGVWVRGQIKSPADNWDTSSSGINIALGKTVSVSSVEASGFEGSHAVDGNASTRWSSLYADPQWITVDLGGNYDINRVKISWEAAYGKDFLVQVSTDNTNWTTVKNITGNTSLTNNYTDLSAAGRYVRIYGTARGSVYGYSIYALEVYGTLASPPNIALNKPVMVSSVEAKGYEGNYAVDGDTSTRWSSTLYVDPQWITVDLGDTYNINRVKLTWEAAYAQGYLIQVSPDNTNWTTVKNITGNTSLINNYTGLSATGRYVRIYGTVRGSAYGYSIYTLEVYGTLASGLPNLALNKTTTTSSIETSGMEGNYAVDGSTSTRWSSLYADPQWISVDLGNTFTISKVKITWEAAYASNYLVQVSSDNSNWTTVQTVTNNTALFNNITGLSASGRYLRIYGMARGSTYGYSIYELEVYGASTLRQALSAPVSATQDKATQISVYPIPATDLVTISIPSSSQTVSQVVLTDINGKVIKMEAASGNTHVMNMSQLPAGLYIIQVTNGHKKSVARIVKK